MSVMRTKSIDALLLGAETKGLKKTLGALDMTLLGIGCIIGTECNTIALPIWAVKQGGLQCKSVNKSAIGLQL